MKGLGILVGDIGAGKTTLARRLLDSLPENEYEAGAAGRSSTAA